MPKFGVNLPVSHMPVGAPTPVARPRVPQFAGGRSGLGRLQKIGKGSGYDSSGINPGARKPNLSSPLAAPAAPPKTIERPIGGVRKNEATS